NIVRTELVEALLHLGSQAGAGGVRVCLRRKAPKAPLEQVFFLPVLVRRPVHVPQRLDDSAGRGLGLEHDWATRARRDAVDGAAAAVGAVELPVRDLPVRGDREL